jgi:DNA-binding NarL/FixJ family response regulator
VNKNLKKLRIFIVDDVDMMRILETQYLNKHDEVEIVGEARDGDEALKKAQEYMPDVILMDMNLPGISGVAVSKNIKKILPAVRIYLCSAYPVDQYRQMNLESPADGFIQKSCLKDELSEMIRREMERKNIVNN